MRSRDSNIAEARSGCWAGQFYEGNGVAKFISFAVFSDLLEGVVSHIEGPAQNGGSCQSDYSDNAHKYVGAHG